MTGSASSISARVVAAYRSSREAGTDEWTECEKALEVFRRAHPEASSDFANTFISDVLREAYPWPTPRHAVPSAGQLAADSRPAEPARESLGSGVRL
jgi:hypothetical protein